MVTPRQNRIIRFVFGILAILWAFNAISGFDLINGDTLSVIQRATHGVATVQALLLTIFGLPRDKEDIHTRRAFVLNLCLTPVTLILFLNTLNPAIN